MKTSKSKSKSGFESTKVLVLSHFKVNYMIRLTNEELTKYGVENISDIGSLNDLPFILEEKLLWNKFEIVTENEELKTFLYMNKCLPENNKVPIEIITFELKDISQSKYKEMINAINLNYYITLNDKALKEDSGETINIIIKTEDNEKTFELPNDQVESYVEKESPAQKKSYGQNTKSNVNTNKTNENKKDENQNKDNNNIFDKIELLYDKYDYFICFFDEVNEIDPIDNFIDFISKLKNQYNSNIIIFYSDTTEKFSDDDSMKQLNKIYLLTDTFIIDSKDAVSNFNKHYETFRAKNKKEEKDNKGKNQKEEGMTEKDINDYFIQTIACRGELSLQNSKVCFILDEKFTKITILEVPLGGKSSILNYDVKPFPKINKSNIDFVKKYKDELNNNKDKYKNIFYAGLLSKYCQSKNKIKGVSDLYPSYLYGCELLKRCLDLIINEYDNEVNPKFYIIRLNKEEIEKYIKKVENEKIEGQFVLDCINISKSKMKYYVPLFDRNLYEYFGQDAINKELKKKGFITNKGYVNYDPLYREGMGVQKSKKNTKEKKDKQVIINQLKENEENNSERIIKNTSPTKRKIPNYTKSYYEETIKKNTRKYKTKSPEGTHQEEN